MCKVAGLKYPTYFDELLKLYPLQASIHAGLFYYVALFHGLAEFFLL
jgi:hypothetical protein